MNSKLKTAIALVLVLLTLVSCSPATGNPDGTSADDTSVINVYAINVAQEFGLNRTAFHFLMVGNG